MHALRGIIDMNKPKPPRKRKRRSANPCDHAKRTGLLGVPGSWVCADCAIHAPLPGRKVAP